MNISSRISAGIWRRNEFEHPELDRRLAGITAFHTARTMGIRYKSILHAHHIEHLLLQCQTDWCFIQAPGHVYSAKDVTTLRRILLRMTEREDVAAVGHLMDDKAYFGFHHQAMLINVKLWHDAGRPMFGAARPGEQLVQPVRRSEENVHDDYTPIWIGPKKGPPLKVNPTSLGWNFISQMSKLGHWFLNFTREMRNRKYFCYPLKSNAASMHHTLLDLAKQVPAEDSRVTAVAQRLRTYRPAGIHVINNEGNEDIPAANPAKVDCAILVATGFKGNVILRKLGFEDHTHVILYDIDEATLEYKRRLIRDWDGRNFLGHAASLVEGLKDSFETGIFRDVDLAAAYEKMIREDFGSEDAWVAHWNRFRTLKFSYVKSDILRDPAPIMEQMKGAEFTGRQVVWTSNIFNYGVEIVGMAFEEREKAHASLIQGIKDVTRRDPVFIGQLPRDYAEGRWV